MSNSDIVCSIGPPCDYYLISDGHCRYEGWCEYQRPLKPRPEHVWGPGDDEKLIEEFNKMFPYDPPLTLEEIQNRRRPQ